MTSILSRLFPGRKNSEKISKDPSNNIAKAPSRKKKKIFGFRSSKDEYQSHGEVSYSTNGLISRSKQMGSNQSLDAFPHAAPKSSSMEHFGEPVRAEEIRELEERILGTNDPKNRRMAYDIFSNENSRNTNGRQRTAHNFHFTSEPSLNTLSDDPRGQKEPPPPLREREQLLEKRRLQEQQKFNKQQQQKQQQQRRNTNADTRIASESAENRKKKPESGLFSGLRGGQKPKQIQNGADAPLRKPGANSGVRRTESMYGYVPRAVCLHDASAVLFGTEKRPAVQAQSASNRLDKFAQVPLAPVKDEVEQTSSSQRSVLSPRVSKFRAEDRTNDDDDDDNDDDVYLQSPTEAGERIANRRSTSVLVSNNFQQSSNGNFFFGRSQRSETMYTPSIAAVQTKFGNSRRQSNSESTSESHVMENLNDVKYDSVDNGRDSSTITMDDSDSPSSVSPTRYDNHNGNGLANSAKEGPPQNSMYTQIGDVLY